VTGPEPSSADCPAYAEITPGGHGGWIVTLWYEADRLICTTAWFWTRWSARRHAHRLVARERREFARKQKFGTEVVR
jgi:hypothetical protein